MLERTIRTWVLLGCSDSVLLLYVAWTRPARTGPGGEISRADRAHAERKGTPDCRSLPLYRAVNSCCSGSRCPPPSSGVREMADYSGDVLEDSRK